jgi:hypothetical protein
MDQKGGLMPSADGEAVEPLPNNTATHATDCVNRCVRYRWLTSELSATTPTTPTKCDVEQSRCPASQIPSEDKTSMVCLIFLDLDTLRVKTDSFNHAPMAFPIGVALAKKLIVACLLSCLELSLVLDDGCCYFSITIVNDNRDLLLVLLVFEDLDRCFPQFRPWE